MDEVVITRDDAGPSGAYRARVKGQSAEGYLSWVLRGTDRVAEHTVVPPAIGGRGVAGKLVEALAADAETSGFRIVPACSYVAAWFRRHPERAALLAE